MCLIYPMEVLHLAVIFGLREWSSLFPGFSIWTNILLFQTQRSVELGSQTPGKLLDYSRDNSPCMQFQNFSPLWFVQENKRLKNVTEAGAQQSAQQSLFDRCTRRDKEWRFSLLC